MAPGVLGRVGPWPGLSVGMMNSEAYGGTFAGSAYTIWAGTAATVSQGVILVSAIPLDPCADGLGSVHSYTVASGPVTIAGVSGEKVTFTGSGGTGTLNFVNGTFG